MKIKKQNKILIKDRTHYSSLAYAKFVAKGYKSVFNSNNRALKIEILYYDENGNVGLYTLRVRGRKRKEWASFAVWVDRVGGVK